MAAPKSMTSLPQARSAFDGPNLRRRLVSAAILAPAALLAVWVGGWLYLVMVAVALALLSVEWGAMSGPTARNRAAAVVLAGTLVPVFLAYVGLVRWAWPTLGLAAAGSALLASLWRGAERPIDAAFGVLYLGVPGVALVWLRSPEHGRGWVLTLLCVTWAADSAAFFAGSLLKGPKLWPRISPNKTWAGLVGGLVAGAVAAVALRVAMWDSGPPSLAVAAAVGLIAALATMGGDLGESMLKRRFGVKDSGDLIPGHGGLLDRVDGLLVAVLAVDLARWALQGVGAV